MRPLATLLIAIIGSTGCSSNDQQAPAETAAVLHFDADLSDPEQFYSLPYPSDLRLDSRGAPVFRLPNRDGKRQVDALAAAASDRRGFPVVPVAYFRFTAPLARRAPSDVIAASVSSPVFLIDVDPASPEKGTLVPTVAHTLDPDPYVAENVLAIAPRPGFVLRPKRRYAVVVRTSANDAAGKPLAPARGLAARALYAPLFEQLDALGVKRDDVASATVFTTGDVVADTAALSDAVLGKHEAKIDAMVIDSVDGSTHERYCELRGTVTLPQFQKGVPPFNEEGLFVVGGDGLPQKQRDEAVPFTITLPKGAMPDAGYPLVMYFHGSGGDSREVVDSGPKKTKEGDYEIGTGPSHVLAAHGFATASSALPISPERVRGVSDFDYLNFANLPAFRDNFRQGMIEQRLLIRALSTWTISKESLAACTGMSLPAGASAYKLDTTRIGALGLSMGGMYTNLISAVEPTIGAAVPTGAGGHWSYFVEVASPRGIKVRGLVQAMFNIEGEASFMHPVFHLFETVIEPVEPAVYMPRLGNDPLPLHPARSVYEPVGKDDQYFPTILFDAVALSYQHPQAGEVVWSSMQDALKLAGRDGLRAYPLTNNLTSSGGKPFTSAVVQYPGDGIGDPHVIVFQLDAVKYQYGCFLESFFRRGTATIPAPAPLGTACP